MDWRNSPTFYSLLHLQISCIPSGFKRKSNAFWKSKPIPSCKQSICLCFIIKLFWLFLQVLNTTESQQKEQQLYPKRILRASCMKIRCHQSTSEDIVWARTTTVTEVSAVQWKLSPGSIPQLVLCSEVTLLFYTKLYFQHSLKQKHSDRMK